MTHRRILWVDAICIDQTNESERNHQVNQMGDVYSQATQVLVWLGLETAWSRRLLALLRRTVHKWERNRQHGYSKCMAGEWDNMQNLCSMEYWGRLWIIQEVALAPCITICCGPDSVSWKAIEHIYGQVVRRKPLGRRQVLSKDSSLGIWATCKPQPFLNSALGKLIKYQIKKGRLQLHDRFHRFESASLTTRRPRYVGYLVDLLFMFDRAACKDPRDVVFGLHSLCDSCCQKATPVDYSKDTFEIYNSAFSHH